MSLTLETIEEAAIAQQGSDNVWSDMVDFISTNKITTSSNLNLILKDIEEEFLVKYFSHDFNAKTSKGKWKKSYKYTDYQTGEERRKYLIPQAWTTAKSIAGKALDAGEALSVDGKPLGQTGVAKSARMKLAGTSNSLGENTLDDILRTYNRIVRRGGEMTKREKQAIGEVALSIQIEVGYENV